MNNHQKQPSAWTEVLFHSEDYHPLLKEGLLSRATEFRLCHADGREKTVRQSLVVFRAKGSEDWEDDAPIGRIEAMVLGDDEEEVMPVEVVNLGTSPAELISVVRQTSEKVVIAFDWEEGKIDIPLAKQTSDGYELSRADVADGNPILCHLTPHATSSMFTLEINLPFLGFTLSAPNGQRVEGNLTIDVSQLDDYTYKFLGNEDDNRFAIHFNDLSLAYQYVWYDDGTLSIRNQRKRMEKVGETRAMGSLKSLLGDAKDALIKHKDQRWRILITDTVAVERKIAAIATDPIALVRETFGAFKEKAENAEDENALLTELLKKEDNALFQWFWLTDADLAHEHLLDLLNMPTASQDSEGMLAVALLYDRFLAFMKRLRKTSLSHKNGTLADALQTRNNKRRISRTERLFAQHFAGETSLWTTTMEQREEIIKVFRMFDVRIA